jgi:hypothetical protein
MMMNSTLGFLNKIANASSSFINLKRNPEKEKKKQKKKKK